VRRVIIESPFGKRTDGTAASPDEMAENLRYARACMRDCFAKNEAPYGSHLLYPQIFDDAKPEERRAGMEAGFAWGDVADATVVYTDRGLTDGMREGIARALRAGRPIEHRRLGGWGPTP